MTLSLPFSSLLPSVDSSELFSSELFSSELFSSVICVANFHVKNLKKSLYAHKNVGKEKNLTVKVMMSWLVLPPAVNRSSLLVMPSAKMVPGTTWRRRTCANNDDIS
jgi:hypothetical protein